MSILEQRPGRIPHDLPDATAAPERSSVPHGAQSEAWNSRSNEAVIEHILSRYHDVHREQLPELIRLAQRVELVHGSNPSAPAGLSSVLGQLQRELEEHMHKEETILFPMIARGITGLAMRPAAAMRREHEEHGAALADIDRITHGLQLPAEACNTWRTLYNGLDILKQDLTDHIQLENDVLFTRLEAPQEGVQHG